MSTSWKPLGVLAVAVRNSNASLRRGPGEADLHQRYRADLPGEVRSVPSARLDRADVARDLRRGASVGALDQGARGRASDAAVAHRQDRRHPGVQERSVAHRRSDRHDRALDRSGRAEGRPEGHAAAQGVAERAGLELREAVRPDRTRPDRSLDAVDAEGRRERRLVEAGCRDGPHRAALGSRDRNPSGDRQGPQDHPSRR